MSTSARGVICLPAKDTGLVPDGWRVISDVPDTEIDLSKLDFSSPLAENENWISGDTLLERAESVKAMGSLGLAKLVLHAQESGYDVIPRWLRGKVYIVLPRTSLHDRRGRRRVAVLSWSGERWFLYFDWLDNEFDFNSGARMPRLRE